MIKNDELKTTGRQRIIIIAIAAFMLLSTFALYASVIMGNGSKTATTTTSSEKQERFNELYQKYLDALDVQADELSAKYFDEFVSYKSRVRAFNAADVDDGVVGVKFAVAALELFADPLYRIDYVETGDEVHIDLGGVSDQSEDRLVCSVGNMNAEAEAFEPFDQLFFPFT